MQTHRMVLLAFAVSLACVGCIGTSPSPETSPRSVAGDNPARPAKTASAINSAEVSPCDLPNIGNGGVARPTGSSGNLSVLDWAGFESAVSWSYDDAQPSHIEHYAALSATGVRQTFYLSTGDGNRANLEATWARAVQDGHELGNHTAHHCHANGDGCSFGAWAGSIGAEFDQCTAFITQNYPQEAVWTSASPFGDSGYDHEAQSRFFLNRGVKSGSIGPNDATDPFELPCHMAVSDESADSFNRVILAAKSARKWVIMLIHSVNPTNAKWYNPVDLEAITSSIAATKELGTVWQDSVVNVGAYWMGQRVVLAGSTRQDGNSLIRSWTLPKHFPRGRCLRVKVDGGVLRQNGREIAWNDHGYYEIALDAGSLTLSAN